jgi:hypothetical protein
MESVLRLFPIRTGVAVPDWVVVGHSSQAVGAAGVKGAGYVMHAESSIKLSGSFSFLTECGEMDGNGESHLGLIKVEYSYDDNVIHNGYTAQMQNPRSNDNIFPEFVAFRENLFKS